jgi:hypothetical protein
MKMDQFRALRDDRFKELYTNANRAIQAREEEDDRSTELEFDPDTHAYRHCDPETGDFIEGDFWEIDPATEQLRRCTRESIRKDFKTALNEALDNPS